MATRIGLDIGSSAVRAAEITAGRRGPGIVERLGQVVLPRGAVREGEIVEVDAVAAAIRTLWSRYGFKGTRVALGVGNQQVIVRQMDLPALPQKEQRQSLEFQVQDSIPIPIDQAILDFHTLEDYETPEGQRFSRLLVVAAQREMIEGVLGVVRAAKLVPTGVDLDALAMLRSLAPERVSSYDDGEMLVDIGASVTNLVVHRAGVPHFVRILLMGGDAITEALVNAHGMDYDDAEEFKITGGAGAAHAGVIVDRAQRFVDEIRNSLDYYGAQGDAIPVRRTVVSGGGSQLANLRERLADTLRMPVERGHPMQTLQIGNVGLDAEQLIETEPYLAVAIGLALGETS